MKKGAAIDQAKVIAWKALAIAALRPPDTIGLAVSHFIEEGRMDFEAWGRPRDRDKPRCGANRGTPRGG